MHIRNFILGGVVAAAFAAPVFGQDAPPLPTESPGAAPVSSDLPGFSQNPALTVSPVRFEADVAGGETKRGVVDVFNVSAQTVTVQAEAENARMVGEQGQLEFFLGTNPFKLNSFVQVEAAPFVLQPGEARRVAFAISVPSGIFPGGYYGALFMRLVPTQPAGTDTAVAVGGRAGTLLLITVPGEIQRQGQLQSLTTRGALLTTRRELAATYRNTGNTETRPLGVAVRPTGEIRLRNSFGRVVQQEPVTGEIIFPGSTRQLKVGISRPWWFGRYTAEVSLVADPGGLPSVKQVSFWAFSPVAIATVVILLGLAVYLVRRLVRQRRRRSAPVPPAAPQSSSLLEDAERPTPLDRPDRRP